MAPTTSLGSLRQHDVGAFDRDVSSGPDGEADVRLGQGRRLVDPITDHPDAEALCLQFLHFVRLLTRQDIR
jgi:hypothetical protein